MQNIFLSKPDNFVLCPLLVTIADLDVTDNISLGNKSYQMLLYLFIIIAIVAIVTIVIVTVIIESNGLTI